MFYLVLLAGVFGYSVGFEGVEKEKVYVGVYTPKNEYGWVVSQRGIYLDTVLEKNNVDALTSR